VIGLSKKGLLIGAVLVFLLIASAMALENRSADENFTSQEYHAKSINSNSLNSSNNLNSSNAPDLSVSKDSGAGFGTKIVFKMG